MKIENFKFLSYVLDVDTPTYGNRNKFEQIKKNDITKGDIANDTAISTTVHIGTHIDMPYHFYKNGQTIEDFDVDFWRFSQEEILFVELRIDNEELIIRDELIDKLEKVKNNSQFSILNFQLLIVKTGICHKRNKKNFWEKNYGFHPDIANYLRENFPSIRVFGFDSISVSSFQNRVLGRETHKRFLNPKKPILLLEDMDLRDIDKNTQFKEIIIAPLRIAKCDGLPCTIIAKLSVEEKRKNKKQFSTILWDFDGVILDSMKIKGDGFIELFKDYDKSYLLELEKYHYENGGVSRFDKIEYFYNKIIKRNITKDKVEELADKFANIIKNKLYNKENLISETIDFIKNNYNKYNFHIVSGAEHQELNNICNNFELTCYFKSIDGSPVKKDILIKNIIKKYKYQKKEVILIGDSITDYNASAKNGIGFYGYNNIELKKFGNYIDSFKGFKI